MSEYIQVENGVITAHVCGANPENGIEVPDFFAGIPGMRVEEFNKDWSVRPLADRVKDGLVLVDDRHVVENNEVRPKKLSELVADGIVKIDEYHVLEGEGVREKTQLELIYDKVIPRPKGIRVVLDAKDATKLVTEDMSLLEQVAAGDITQAEADKAEGTYVRASRALLFTQYDQRVAQLAREIRTAEAKGDDATALRTLMDKWDEYAKALEVVPDQPGFPWTIEWPQNPDGVGV